jgi:uncharacterized protein YdhG (YjbR/CyaY superfamily)
MNKTPATADEYLAALPRGRSEALEKLRTAIRTAAPDAREYIGSGVPAFRYGRKYLVGFGAARRHVALYITRGSALETLKDDLQARTTPQTPWSVSPRMSPSLHRS